MMSILRLFLILSMLILAGIAGAAQWVATPTTIPGTSGVFEAGGGCCAWVKITGDHMLFFDIWSGEWTEVTLPETHVFQSVEAAGNLVLVVYDDLAVAFNGPEKTTNLYPLTGTLLRTGFSGTSFGCGNELAAVMTDAEFIVFDARLDSWRVLANPLPADFESFQTLTVESDFVVVELRCTMPSPAANRVYSLHTGTFLEIDEGVRSVASGHLLDHGYAGITGISPDLKAIGYSSFTGGITVGAEVSDGILESGIHSRDRMDLSHLAPAVRHVILGPDEAEYHLWVFDSLTGGWDYNLYAYDYGAFAPSSNVHIGGRFVSHPVREDLTRANSILFYSGVTHAFTSHDPGLFGTSLGMKIGGTVVAYKGGIAPDPPLWWCRSVQHPTGQYTTSTRDWVGEIAAGDDWFCTAQRTNGDPLMDLFFYHGPTNTMTQVETWASTSTNNSVPGAHVNTLLTIGADVQVNFYSSTTNTVEQRTFPPGSSVAQRVNDDLSLVYQNGVDDYLFDARSGAVLSRGIDYTNNSLGTNLVIGYDSSGDIAHGYSAMTQTWSTQALGATGYGYAGDNVAVFRLNDGSKYWGYSALDDSWTELVTTGALELQYVGVQTIIVGSTDRAWAFWPSEFISAVNDGTDSTPMALAHAVDQVQCYPNPFNGRTLVEFSLPVAADVKIQVFDVRGRLVKTLMNERRKPGKVMVPWQTERVASGTYLVRLTADEQVATRKLMLVQ